MGGREMKILNLYAGLGGNRKLWTGHEVTAVEYNQEVADLYAGYFPNDTMIVGDAHQYLLDHYNEFDFIWSSPPCPTHSRPRMWASKGGRYPVKYPDMKLYEEIILLQNFRAKPWWIENVKPYYTPLIPVTKSIGRHSGWGNFNVPDYSEKDTDVQTWSVTSTTEKYGFSVAGTDIKHRKDQLIRNLVNPAIGLHILNSIPL
jgi:DNA (cytosine-5)-methyltransferase 1